MIAIPHINFLCLIRSKYGLIALKSGLIKIREIAMLSEVQLNYLVNRQEGYKCLCKQIQRVGIVASRMFGYVFLFDHGEKINHY